jgi:hypothetical protein
MTPSDNVTASDVFHSGKRQFALLHYKVRELLFPSSGGWIAPRWVRVEVLDRVGDQVTITVVTQHGRPAMAWVIQCRNCQMEYADKGNGGGRPPSALCIDCERKRDTLRQRRRRSTRRFFLLAQTCAHCGLKMEKHRGGQRFCGDACRVAAHRAKGRQ